MSVPDIVGVLSGLIAIFSFLTGVTSARELRRPRTGGSAVAAPRRSQLRLMLVLSVPAFVVSLVVTLTAGLGGSDTGGAQFLLLLTGAGLLVLYATGLRRTLPWPGFLVLCVVALSVAGLLMGSISRGEEAEGLTAGLVIGLGVALLGLAFRGVTPRIAGPTGAPRRPGGRADQERDVLRAAHQHSGEVSAADVALSTALSLDDARIVLDQLSSRGFCQRRVLTSGAVLYRFPEFGAR